MAILKGSEFRNLQCFHAKTGEKSVVSQLPDYQILTEEKLTCADFSVFQLSRKHRFRGAISMLSRCVNVEIAAPSGRYRHAKAWLSRNRNASRTPFLNGFSGKPTRFSLFRLFLEINLFGTYHTKQKTLMSKKL